MHPLWSLCSNPKWFLEECYQEYLRTHMNMELLEVLNSEQIKMYMIHYRHEILTFELEKEKLFRFSHISIGNVGKTE